MMRDRPYDEGIAELFRKDISCAVNLLNDILEDGDPAELRIVLRQLALAFPHIRSETLQKIQKGEDLHRYTKDELFQDLEI